MILYQHPDDYLKRFHEERGRMERRAQLLRALRGTTPPFDGPTQKRLEQVLPEPPCREALAAEHR